MENLYFEVGNATVIDKDELIEATNAFQFATAKIDCFSSGNNAHNMPVEEETLKKYAETILGKPIVYVIEKPWGFKKKEEDFGTHDPLEIPMGYIGENPNLIEFNRLKDGRLMLTVYARIWKKYAKKAMEIFKRDGGTKPVSVEIQVIQTKEDSFKRKEITDFAFAGCAILGTDVSPAIQDANIEILSFAKAKEEDIELNPYNKIDFSIPENLVQRVKLATKDLQEMQNFADLSLEKANYIIENKNFSPEKVEEFIAFMKEHENDIAFSLCGGKESKEWLNSIKEQMFSVAGERSSEESETKEDEQMSNVNEEVIVEEELENKEFSDDENLEIAAQAQRLENEGEGDKEVVENAEDEEKVEEEEMSEEADEEESEEPEMAKDDEEEEEEKEEVNYESKFSELEEKFNALQANFDTLKEERDQLFTFKSAVVANERKEKIEFTMLELSKVLPKDILNECKEKAEKCESVDSWANEMKALAFSYVVKDVKKESGITRMALPTDEPKKKETKSLWED